MPFALIALTIASFGIGTTEFVIMGLLPDVANDLGVAIAVAGMLVSGYALSVAIGAPIVAVATIHLPRKVTLRGLMFGCYSTAAQTHRRHGTHGLDKYSRRRTVYTSWREKTAADLMPAAGVPS
jgi:hypothetical protein